jgi:hypothetical protein
MPLSCLEKHQKNIDVAREVLRMQSFLPPAVEPVLTSAPPLSPLSGIVHFWTRISEFGQSVLPERNPFAAIVLGMKHLGR